MRQLWQTYVLDVRNAADGEARDRLAATSADAVDRRFVTVIMTVIGCLILIRFFGSPARYMWLVDLLKMIGLPEAASDFANWMSTDKDYRFHRRIFWATTRCIAYLLIPMAVIKLVLRDSLRDYGWRFRGILRSGLTYGLMMLIMLPVTFFASFGAGFQSKYPYYRVSPGESLWPFFIGWELLYALSFVGLEFFYRGFMVHGTRWRTGYASIFIMMVPYTMIHFGKPLPEAVGSVMAGFVLGTLSLKSGSVIWGAVIHIAVAWQMDWLALWHQGRLGPLGD